MYADFHPREQTVGKLLHLELFEEALQAALIRIFADPTDGVAWHQYGIALLNTCKDDEPVITAFRRAIMLAPDLDSTRMNLGILLKDRAPTEARLHLAVLQRRNSDMAGLLEVQIL